MKRQGRAAPPLRACYGKGSDAMIERFCLSIAFLFGLCLAAIAPDLARPLEDI